MRISTGQIYQQSVSNILNKQSDLARLQAQIATGKRILSPSDDPAASAQVLDIENATSQTDQYQRNADMATSRLQLEETMVSSASDLIVRARELVLQGRSGQYSDRERGYTAVEVRQLLDQMVSLANTRDGNGEYLFAGFQGKTQPFALNSGTGNVDYGGDQGSRVVNISPTNAVADSDPGSDVFMMIRNGNGTFATSASASNAGTGVINVGSVTDASSYAPNDYRIAFTSPTTYNILDDTNGSVVASAQSYSAGSAINFGGMQVVVTGEPAAGDEFSISPSGNQSVFETLQTLAEALETPLVSSAEKAQFQTKMNQSMAGLDRANERMLEIRASIGARENIIDSQKSFNEDINLQMKGLRSSLEDADLVEAISSLNLQITTLQAAQGAFARMQNLSLFNYL